MEATSLPRDCTWQVSNLSINIRSDDRSKHDIYSTLCTVQHGHSAVSRFGGSCVLICGPLISRTPAQQCMRPKGVVYPPILGTGEHAHSDLSDHVRIATSTTRIPSSTTRVQICTFTPVRRAEHTRNRSWIWKDAEGCTILARHAHTGWILSAYIGSGWMLPQDHGTEVTFANREPIFRQNLLESHFSHAPVSSASGDSKETTVTTVVTISIDFGVLHASLLLREPPLHYEKA